MGGDIIEERTSYDDMKEIFSLWDEKTELLCFIVNKDKLDETEPKKARTCSQCGAECAKGISFCGKCGAKLDV